MNKSKLIDLIGAAVSVTGDIRFEDTGNSVLSLAQNGELNTPAICLLVIETNAISEVIFQSYCLPFHVYKKAANEQLLLSDFDGEVNFEKRSNSIALMLMVRAIENIFEHKAGLSPKPLKESDINARFAEYASQFDVGTIVSSLERSDMLVVDLLQEQVKGMLNVLSSSLDEVKELASKDGQIDISSYTLDEPDVEQNVGQIPAPEQSQHAEPDPAQSANDQFNPFKM